MTFDWRDSRPYGYPPRGIDEVRAMLRIIAHIMCNYEEKPAQPGLHYPRDPDHR